MQFLSSYCFSLFQIYNSDKPIRFIGFVGRFSHGKGKPLVFIPGLTFSGEIFKNQLEYFSSEYRAIAIDPRGQGYSAKTVDGNDYLTHGRDVAGLIDALGDRKSVV